MYQGKKMRSRPNQLCLNCDSSELSDCTHARAFYTCSQECKESLCKSISPLSMRPIMEGNYNPKNKKRQSVFELACSYFVLRQAKEPLTGFQIRDRVNDLFGAKKRSRSYSFTRQFSYFESNIVRIKQGGKYVFSIEDKDIEFSRVLKPKYQSYVYGINL